MDLRFSPEEEAFKGDVRRFLDARLTGEYACLRGRGGPGDEEAYPELRRAWEAVLGEAGYVGLGWPTAHGGRGASLMEQVLFGEEYARQRGPGRLGHIGEHLVAPTLIAFGTDAQRRRFLPEIQRGQLWCQGYSEPDAGSDLASVRTRAERSGSEWVLHGQKVWTSHAHLSDWAFVLCRTDPAAPKHRGLSYLLVPMRQPGIAVRPIPQMTGGSEFSEVFFDGARTEADLVVGDVNGGWRVAMGTLAFERGVSTLGQQIGFGNELAKVIEIARRNGAAGDPLIRQRIARAWTGLRVMRWNALRTLGGSEQGELGRTASIGKLYWSEWHQRLGELAMDVLGAEAEVAEPGSDAAALQRVFLFSRADTIYAGTSEIQRNLIGERALGLPPEPRPTGGTK